MTFYTDMQAVATDLLTEFDQGGIVVSYATPGGGPAHNPGPTTYADTWTNGAVRGVSRKYIDGVNVVATDLQVTVPGTLTAPTLTDRVKLAGVVHQIVQVIPKPATGTVAAFVLIVRK